MQGLAYLFGTLMLASILARTLCHFSQALFRLFLLRTHPLPSFNLTWPRPDLLQNLPGRASLYLYPSNLCSALCYCFYQTAF